MRTLLGALEKQATPALLGLETLEILECSECLPGADAPISTLRLKLLFPQHDAPPRGALARDGGWRRTTISSFFGSSSTTREASYVVDVTTVTRELSVPAAAEPEPAPPAPPVEAAPEEEDEEVVAVAVGPPTDGAPTVDGAVGDGTAAEEVETEEPAVAGRAGRRRVAEAAAVDAKWLLEAEAGASVVVGDEVVRTERWIVAESLAAGGSRALALESRMAALNVVPHAAVAARLLPTASRPSKARSAAASPRRRPRRPQRYPCTFSATCP